MRRIFPLTLKLRLAIENLGAMVENFFLKIRVVISIKKHYSDMNSYRNFLMLLLLLLLLSRFSRVRLCATP